MFDVFLFCRIIDDSSLQRDGEDTNLVAESHSIVSNETGKEEGEGTNSV